MIRQTLILILVCFWYCEANSELSALFHKNSETHSEPCIHSDISLWEAATRAKLENDVFADSFVNKTKRIGRGRRKNLVMVKLSNKRRRRKLVNIKAEKEYKIEIMNKLQAKVEVLLIVDFQNKSDCGVGTLIKEDFNISKFQQSDDSPSCFSIESSVEPRRRVMYPFLTPKCGCFTFRYHFAYREENATVIRSPDPTSPKPHKKLTKTFCLESEEDSDGGEIFPGKRKKHNRRRGGKKGFFKKNRRLHRKPESLSRYTSSGSNSRRTLSRSKKDLFQIWETPGRHTTSNPPYLDINHEDDARTLSDKIHENEIVENEINTNGIYNNVHPEEDNNEEHDEYEIENEDQVIEEEERNLIEDFEYEDENEDDERNFDDYEKEDISEENDSENDEEGYELKSDENSGKDDDESNENDEEDHHNDNINMKEGGDLGDNENYDEEDNNNQENVDKNCDSDESEESSEEQEDETEITNDSEEVLETEDTKIKEKNSINSVNALYGKRNNIRPRLNIRRKSFEISHNNGTRRRNNFPRRRTHNFRNRRKHNHSFTRIQPFKPWKESNRSKWQRKHGINVNNIKASSTCCRQGVNRKKLILHNRLENNFEYNKTCDEFPHNLLSWVEETFNVTEEFCHQKFSSCCNNWSLLSPDHWVPYYPTRRQDLI